MILTAFTTVLGLIPLTFGINIDFVGLLTRLDPNFQIGSANTQFWGPMGDRHHLRTHLRHLPHSGDRPRDVLPAGLDRRALPALDFSETERQDLRSVGELISRSELAPPPMPVILFVIMDTLAER